MDYSINLLFMRKVIHADVRAKPCLIICAQGSTAKL